MGLITGMLYGVTFGMLFGFVTCFLIFWAYPKPTGGEAVAFEEGARRMRDKCATLAHVTPPTEDLESIIESQSLGRWNG